MVKVDIDVSGVTETLNEFKRDLHRGAENAADDMVEDAKDEARNVIESNQAIFNGEVYAGFRDADTGSGPSSVRRKIYNKVEHADALERGAEYTDSGPPVQALLPWVKRKMDWNPDQDFGPDDHSGIPTAFQGSDSREPDDKGGSSSGSNSTPEKINREYSDSDVETGDRVYVSDDRRDRLVTINSKDSNSFVAENESGEFEYRYDQIISPKDTHPISTQDGRFEEGDRVQFYDGDTLLNGILTGDADSFFSVNEYETVLEETGDTIGYVPETEFVHWESAPEVDSSLISDSMRPLDVSNSSDAQDELVHYLQDVVIHNPMTGESESAVVQTSPWTDELQVSTDEDRIISIDFSDWSIKSVDDFSELSESKQADRLISHWSDNIDVTGGDESDREYIEDSLRDTIIESYSDRKHLLKVFQTWESQEITTDRSAVDTGDDGWKLKTYPEPSKMGSMSESTWENVFAHESGHYFSKPDPVTTGIMTLDPEDYKFGSVWPDRNQQEYSHMYEASLPNWEFDASDPFHGPKEIYMFSGPYGGDYVTYGPNDEIIEDNRDGLNPFGFSHWGDQVREIGIADAEDSSVAQRKMKYSVSEITKQQAFKRDNWEDDFSIDRGEKVALEVDGEEKVFELGNRDRESTPFSKNPDEDVPEEAEPVTFETLDDSILGLSVYVGKDGTLYRSESDGNETPHLSGEGISFVGKATVTKYDESLDKFPDLTQTDDVARLQEAANMAWWHQVTVIENDPTDGKDRAFQFVEKDGYSSTNAEEIMATFNEALVMETLNPANYLALNRIVEHYPFYIEEYLNQRKPVSDAAKNILRDNGFDVQ